MKSSRMQSALRNTYRLLAVAILPFAVSSRSALAQVIHLPPIYRPVLPGGTTILSFTSSNTLANATIQIQDDQIVITHGAAIDIVPLGSRLVKDVVNELRTKYGADIVVTTPYPLVSVSNIGAQGTVPLNGANIGASSDRPEVGLGFGVVLALRNGDNQARTGLLSQAGFQLDATGSFQIRRPQKQRDWTSYIQARLGLNADQQLNVRTEEQASGVSDTEGQFQAALEQADQVALTGQLDWVRPLGSDDADFVLSPIYGVSWTQLEDFEFPLVLVGDSLRNSEELFDQQLVTRVRRELARTLPLSEVSLLGVFQFRRNGRPLFYFGGGAVYKEVVERRILFTRDAGGTPDKNSLSSSITTPWDPFWRAVFGARIGGVIDLRVDASGPIGGREAEPLLRILIGRGFPVTSSQ